MRKLAGWLFVAAVVLVVIAVLSGGSGESSEEDPRDDAADVREGDGIRPFRATNAGVERLLVDELGSKPSGDGLESEARTGDVNCQRRRRCLVVYTPDTPAIDADKEILLDMRPIFARVFSDPRLQRVTLEAQGLLTSVGGKESVGPVLSVTCTRRAARKIDWSNVDENGIKALCDYQPFVGDL